MRLAWFSPLPPVKSGVAAYSADILSRLGTELAIDCFVEGAAAPGDRVYDAYDFAWRHRREPYDLTVYQLGNAPCHDYMWGYLAAHPGLVVLHDARLHHARASALLRAGRAADYRAEFQFDHPDAVQHVTEFAVEGLGGPIYSFWSMLRVVMQTARMVAVHNEHVAADLRDAYTGTAIETLRMGVADATSGAGTAARVRRQLGVPDDAVVFTAFGKMTAEKRIGPILRAFRDLVEGGTNAYLLLVGDAGDYSTLARDVGGLEHVLTTGYVDHDAIGGYLSASDVCLCLRWPTALETSASWLHCLAAGRATVISDLAHLADIPAIDPRTWQASIRQPAAAVAIDLLDEERSLLLAMRRLAADRTLRDELARNGHDYWERHHTLNLMADDYRRVIRAALARSAPAPTNLPAHFTNDYSETARSIARGFDVDLDILG